MKKQKLTALLLAGLMCASFAAGFSGCASDDSSASDSTDTSANVQDTAAEVTASPLEDEVGEHDFGGEEFRAASFTHVSTHGELYAAEETGDVLNDAIYKRNHALEDRFNFVFAETPMDGETADARTAVLAGDETYDIITTRCTSAFDYAAEGIVTPLESMPYIDLTKDYWDHSLTDALTIMNKHYFAMGDYNLSSYDYIHLMLFNKKLAGNYAVGDLYATVRDGKWTYDKYVEVTKLATADTDGDGEMTLKDNYGYLSSFKQILPNFWIAAGELSMEKDSEDKPVFSMASDENFLNIFNRIFEITWDEGTWFFVGTTNDMPDEILEAFQSDRSLFLDCTFFRVNSMRSMDTDFGIIPYPKYTEAQEDYRSRLEYCALTCIPVTNPNLDLTGVVLETLSSESAKTVVPAYYDISLQTKLTRDKDSAEMLDIIFDSRVFDWGDTIFSPEIRDGTLRTLFGTNNRDIASKIATMESTVNAKIDKIVTAFDSIM
nr:hypothetical protein [Clostridia bacterium]